MLQAEYRCEECGATFAMRSAFEEHNREVHPELDRTPR